ncbi:hypothetical protein FDECE_2874 [Fusarium decemcellulare]|nr:hypothetical protein FDECE_2874 [Fusarium decemcellulare]
MHSFSFLLPFTQAASVAAAGAVRPSLVSHRSLPKREEGWPIKTGFVAFGDSYGAGMGTGTTTSDKCRVGSNNFGDLLNRWTNNPDVEFQRKVCSGDTTDGLNRQIDEWSDPGKADLATVSVGGNDVYFSDLVWYCVITPNTMKWPSTNRKDCIDTEAKARRLMDDQGDEGLKAKLKAAYKKILDKSSRDDFHIYATSYVPFFNQDDPDCDKTTFHYLWASYDGSWDPRKVLLKTDLRRELNDLVSRLNDVISDAVDETNGETGRDRVHFVDVRKKWDNHRWCEEGDFHEPEPNRQDTWFFLSAWPDVPIEAGGASCDAGGAAPPEDNGGGEATPPEDDGTGANVVSDPPTGANPISGPDLGANPVGSGSSCEEEAERQALIASGKMELPDPGTCNDQLGSDPDPWDHWLCRASQAIRDDPDGPLGESLKNLNDGLAKGDANAQDIDWWVPTRQIKTFHPRSPGMVAYRDAIIEEVRSHQGA